MIGSPTLIPQGTASPEPAGCQRILELEPTQGQGIETLHPEREWKLRGLDRPVPEHCSRVFRMHRFVTSLAHRRGDFLRNLAKSEPFP